MKELPNAIEPSSRTLASCESLLLAD